MQINTGVRALLASPIVYSCVMRLLGSGANRRWFIQEILMLRPGQKIVDIGCGPGRLLAELPIGIEYVGLDVSDAYVAAARQRYGARGLFLAGSLADWAIDPSVRNADVALLNGVLHHMDDHEARAALELARAILKPEGRFIFFEPCYLLWQSRYSVFMMARDRGQNIRTEQQWKDLAAAVFPQVATNIVTNVNRLGYTCIIGQCRA